MNERTRQKAPRNGFNPAMFVDRQMAKRLECGVCLGVLNDPKQCKNGHAFCSGCFDSSLRDNQKCPSCRIRVISDDLSTCLVLCTLVADLTVTCKCLDEQDAKQGCQWTGVIAARSARDCPNLYDNCSFPGCDVVDIRVSKMASHKSRCQRRPVRCDECDMTYPANETALHPDACPSRIIDCICGRAVRFCVLEQHKRSCDMSLVPCPIFHEYGFCVPICIGTVQKRFVWKHVGSEESSNLVEAMHTRYLKQKVIISVSDSPYVVSFLNANCSIL